jgi:hypothetical protein
VFLFFRSFFRSFDDDDDDDDDNEDDNEDDGYRIVEPQSAILPDRSLARRFKKLFQSTRPDRLDFLVLPMLGAEPNAWYLSDIQFEYFRI